MGTSRRARWVLLAAGPQRCVVDVSSYRATYERFSAITADLLAAWRGSTSGG